MPVSRPSQQQRRNTAAGQPTNNSSSPSCSSTGIPTSISDLAGLVVWTPPPEELNSKTSWMGHPAVILTPQRLEDVVILIMTSFSSTDLAEKYPNNARARSLYLPIHPSAHPDNAEVLHLRGRNILRKNSYLNINEKRTVKLDILRPYDRTRPKDYYLRAKSYRKLIQLARFEAIPVTPTPALPPIPATVPTPATSTQPPPRPNHQTIPIHSGNPYHAHPDAQTPLAAQPQRPNLPGAPHRVYAQSRTDPLTTRQLAGIREPRYGTVPYPPWESTLPAPVPSRSRRSAYHGGPAGRSWFEILTSFLSASKWWLILSLVAAGAYAGWVNKAELGRLMVQGLKWCAVHGGMLVMAILKGLWHGMGWVLRSLWGVVKGVAGGLWRWLWTGRGRGKGEVQVGRSRWVWL
ncbi:hypothetical protein QBC39DRAFT_105055 [Podospora conica]|nr:hypothetical protein QBC39DRAFT_105055 [Schizothecium conicum]